MYGSGGSGVVLGHAEKVVERGGGRQSSGLRLRRPLCQRVRELVPRVSVVRGDVSEPDAGDASGDRC